MYLLVPRATYALDLEDSPRRLYRTNVNSQHFNRPTCWKRWAKEFPVVGHNHLDPPEKPRRKYNNSTPEQRRAMTSKGGKASSCAGIRKGFGGHKHLQDLCDAKAFEEGKRIVEVMVKRGMVDKETAGNEALAYAIGVVRGGEEGKIPVATRLQAARMVLDFTLAKPAMKQDVRVSVEDFLADLAEEADEAE